MQKPIRLILLLLLPPALAVGVREYREHQHYPRRFAEVMPRALYRGGYPTADNIRSLHADFEIRSVVNLTDEKMTKEEKEMLDAISGLGMKFFRVRMPGDGRADFAALDMAADAVANRQNWPLFFHCAAGKQRSNATLAAYRLKYDGWTIDQALNELERDYDLDRVGEAPLCDHLRRYAQWLASRRPPSTTVPPASHEPAPRRPE